MALQQKAKKKKVFAQAIVRVICCKPLMLLYFLLLVIVMPKLVLHIFLHNSFKCPQDLWLILALNFNLDREIL